MDKEKKNTVSSLSLESLVSICIAVMAFALAITDPWQGFDHFLTSGLVYFGILLVIFIIISPLLFPLIATIAIFNGLKAGMKNHETQEKTP